MRDVKGLISYTSKQARKLKDYERADNIRDKLKEMNINIEDSMEGTKWIKNE